MTLTLRPARRRLKRRIETLPTAKHACDRFGIWVRKPAKVGSLVCVVCGKP